MKRLVERVITTCWLLAALSTPMRGRARAEDDESEAADSEAAGEVGDSDEHGHEHEHEHERVRFGVDAVIGFGEVTAITQAAPVFPAVVGTTQLQEADVVSTSFIVGASYQLVEGFGLGLRVPLALGGFESPELAARSAVALGNIELEAEYEVELAPGLQLIAALGVALPTSGGEELPESETLETTPVPANPSEWDDYDAYTILHAAELSRGLEENALFESGHLGIVPKLGLDYETGAFGLQVYVKLENLIDTARETHGYIGELVFGAAAGYAITDAFEIATRVWANVSGDGETQAAAAEPLLELHLGPIDALAGAILPIAGELIELHYVGVRAGVSAHF